MYGWPPVWLVRIQLHCLCLVGLCEKCSLVCVFLSSVWPDGYFIFLYLAIHVNEKLPQNSNFCQSRFKIFPYTKKLLKNLPKIFDILPKWQNFAKSGYTASVLLSIGQLFVVNLKPKRIPQQNERHLTELQFRF